MPMSAPDPALVAEAQKSVCTISLPQRAYNQLLADPAVAELKEWVPANFAGPNGAKVFSRQSGKTLRVGMPGAYTYDGFQNAVLDRLEDVAAHAALDRAVFAGGCSENAETSVSALSQDMLKLYYEDFIAQWDSMLRDLRLAPLTDLSVASENLKDLSSADSAAQAPADGGGQRDRADPLRRRGAGRRQGGQEGHLQAARQAGQDRQARQEGREASAAHRGDRRSRHDRRRWSPSTSSRSRAPSPRSTASRRRSTRRWSR